MIEDERVFEMLGNVMKSDFHFRIATLEDVPQMQIVRHLVRENVLSDPAGVVAILKNGLFCSGWAFWGWHKKLLFPISSQAGFFRLPCKS